MKNTDTRSPSTFHAPISHETNASAKALFPRLGFLEVGISTGLVLVVHGLFGCLMQDAKIPLVGLCCAWIVGVCLALPLFLVMRGLANLPQRVQISVWAALGVAGGVLLAQRLGAFAKLGGVYQGLAIKILAGAPLGCAGLGLLLGALFTWSWPSRSRSREILDLGIMTGSLFLALGIVAIDRGVSILLGYPAARFALCFAACTFLLVPVLGLVRWLVARARKRNALGALVAATFLGALLIAATASSSAYDRVLGNPDLARYVALLRRVSDWDRDGYSSFFGDGDCAPFDSSVHPGAIEIPGNGKDDNCQYGDAPLSLPEPLSPPPSTPSPVSVVLITIDAMSPTHMSVYGYARETTPNLSRFAKTARRFTRAYANGGWTALSLPALFDSALPREITWKLFAATDRYRIIDLNYKALLETGERFVAATPVVESLPRRPLPWWLERRGMSTTAVIANEVEQMLRSDFEKDFHDFEAGGLSDDAIADEAIHRLQIRHQEPFFLWVHFYGTHWPYQAGVASPPFGSSQEDIYDRSIFSTDQQIGRLLDQLDAQKIPRLAVIVTADHGESFNAGKGFHGLDLRESGLRVPLLVRGPGISPGESDVTVSSVDIMPTILMWTATPGPRNMEGVPLTQVPRGRIIQTDLWRQDDLGRPYLNSTVAIRGNERVEKDLLTGRRVISRIGDRMDEPEILPDSETSRDLDQAIGRYLERAVGGPL
jgi:hypothetical protein